MVLPIKTFAVFNLKVLENKVNKKDLKLILIIQANLIVFSKVVVVVEMFL